MMGGIYAIIDPEAAAGRDPLAITEMILAAGVKTLQLRAKKTAANAMFELAREMRALCSRAGARLIVNDRLDVALAAAADGVHLGQEDLPPATARGLCPRGLLIGVSTHSVAEAKAAEAGGADYIGFGAMYATRSKDGATPPQGPARLAEVVRATRLPVIAIGGIDRDRIAEVKAAGAAGAAVISALLSAPDAEQAARELVKAWGE